jgi:hypothetical protein
MTVDLKQTVTVDLLPTVILDQPQNQIVYLTQTLTVDLLQTVTLDLPQILTDLPQTLIVDLPQSPYSQVTNHKSSLLAAFLCNFCIIVSLLWECYLHNDLQMCSHQQQPIFYVSLAVYSMQQITPMLI